MDGQSETSRSAQAMRKKKKKKKEANYGQWPVALVQPRTDTRKGMHRKKTQMVLKEEISSTSHESKIMKIPFLFI